VGEHDGGAEQEVMGLLRYTVVVCGALFVVHWMSQDVMYRCTAVCGALFV